MFLHPLAFLVLTGATASPDFQVSVKEGKGDQGQKLTVLAVTLAETARYPVTVEIRALGRKLLKRPLRLTIAKGAKVASFHFPAESLGGTGVTFAVKVGEKVKRVRVASAEGKKK